MKAISVQTTNNIVYRPTLFVRYIRPNIPGQDILAPVKRATVGDAFLQKVKEIIIENIDESDWGITRICEALHLSYMQLFRKMKRLTGESPNCFIRKIRLQKAKELLLTTDLNISEIAYDLGFTDPNYFSRVFSKEMGMAPSAMRKDLKN